MQFNFIWDSSVSSAPAAFKSAIISAGNILAGYFSNSITVNIQVGWGETNGTPVGTALASGTPLAYSFYTPDALTNALSRVATSTDDHSSVSWLNANRTELNGSREGIPVPRYWVGGAEQKLFGDLSSTGTEIDGAIGFGTGFNWYFNTGGSIGRTQYDLIGTALHELTHAMGRSGQGDTSSPQLFDAFDFVSSGSLYMYSSFSAGSHYFSVDGGRTSLDLLDIDSDCSDWAQGTNAADPFDAFLSSGTLAQSLTTVDQRVMDVLGFTLKPQVGDTILNGTVNAVIVGSSGDDWINATGVNATITGGPGNDTIIGLSSSGTVTCTVIYTGSSNNYSLSLNAGPNNSLASITVQDRVGTDGTDTLYSIKNAKFSDQTIDLTNFLKTAALPQSQLTELVDLYIAYFNRAPDAMGLDFWGGQVSNGSSFATLAASFANSPESAAAFPSTLSNSAFVTTVYTNVLGRNTDQTGLNFWVGQLQSGAVIKAAFVKSVVETVLAEASGAPDQQYLGNKFTVGAHFALTQGLSDGAWAKTVMSGVTSNASSVTTANNLTDGFAATAATTAGSEFVVKILGIVA